MGADMKNFNLWLTLRLIRKQKLRTITIFCGILFSCFLLAAFCSFGYDFWMQVHGETRETAQFDSTQGILILLITVLLLLILLCSITLLHNLCSLTFTQRRRSLTRLLALGADTRSIITMELIETLILFCAAAPTGLILALTAIYKIGVLYPAPGWMLGGILAWVLLVSCICNARPLQLVLKKQDHNKRFKSLRRRKLKDKARMQSCSFPLFMAQKYRQANRRFYIRITMTIVAAILLYVPASYLINSNIAAQQSGLHTKYGIQYTCGPQNKGELESALQEYQRLAAECDPNEAAVSVVFYTTASVKTDEISQELRSSLKKAGWQEQSELSVDSTIFFLEGAKDASVLVNRYTNRSGWRKDTDLLFSETSLLRDHASLSGVKIYTDFTDSFEPDETSAITPDSITDEIPEGIDFAGDLTLILPLGQLERFCGPSFDYNRLYVQGKFVDRNEDIFSHLENCLGKHPQGQLKYTRRVLQEWYDSMHGIHQTMNAICLTLFFIAVLNIFSMIIFQYMERKKGLAILWSLGQTAKGLQKIMILEYVLQFLTAISLSIPLSCFLCYYIYRIFRQVWFVPFALPLKQLLLIASAAFLVSSAGILINGYLMKRQNFLTNIKDLT